MNRKAVHAPARARARPQHSTAFRRRRTLNWLVLGLTYSAMYMGRYNLSFANKSLSDAFGWDKTQLGWIITTALSIYGFSAIFNGPIADRLGGRRAMLIGASGTVVFNFLFGLGAYLGFLGKGPLLLAYFAAIWGLCAYFQSYSALALIKVNAGWFHVSERGVFSSIFGMMIQMGRLAIFAIAPLIVAYAPWQWVFFVPSALVAGMAALTYKYVHNGPEDVKLPSLDVEDATSADTEKITLGYVSKRVFTNPVTLAIAAAEFCTGVVRHGFEQWFPRYMQEAQHLSLTSGVFAKGALSVVAAGVVGSFCAGYLSDWLFQNRRTPVAFLGYVTQIACLVVIWKSQDINLVIAAFVLNSFAISIVHSMLSGTASMDFGGKRAAATAAGLFDGMQYVGGSFVGIGMGWLLQNLGWSAWGPSMIGFSVAGALIMLALWNASPRAKAAH